MSSSVYVGNLPNNTTADQLREKFRIYGNIVNVKVMVGYGFVNYDNPSSAQKAILGEHDSMYQDKKIAVRLSFPNKHGLGNANANTNANSAPNALNRSDVQNLLDGPPNKIPKMGNKHIGPGQMLNSYGNNFSGGPGNDQFHYNSAAPPKNDFVKPSVNRNDCEIIVLAKHLTKYAEYVERLLKGYNLAVDLLFPNEEIPLGKVLSSIANRGCLYAILITNENEKFNSITVNILHGIPQEHRNIPTDDAIYLISKNYESYKSGEQSRVGAISTVPKTEKHPEPIQYLFTLLADCRQLTALQYDRVIKYLQERRDSQLKLELGDTSGIDIGLDFKKNELQNRIMSILNKAPINPSSVASMASIFDKFQNKSFM